MSSALNPNAIIGNTGFVGKNLCNSIYEEYSNYEADLTPDWDCYNSKNIADIRGKTFDLVFCAGVSGNKWLANQAGGTDFQAILDLYCHLETCKIKKLVLISTIDVFDEPEFADEDERPTSVEPYGQNRAWLERKLSSVFDTCIVRLPGLFGPHLKKNVIFDLINKRRLEHVNLNCMYQWYPVEWLWKDIQIVLKHDIPITHLVSEPISVKEIVSEYFGDLKNLLKGKNWATYYNATTKYQSFFGKSNFEYIYSKDIIMKELGQYVEKSRLVQYK